MSGPCGCLVDDSALWTIVKGKSLVAGASAHVQLAQLGRPPPPPNVGEKTEDVG